MNTIAAPQVVMCNDGKYRWVYELNLYTNPTILLIIIKIFFWIFTGIWIFLLLLELFDGDLDWKCFWDITRPMMYMQLFMAVFSTLGYFVYCLFVGGKYCVLFEMDEKGVLHKQMPNNVKKAQLIGRISVLAGLVAQNPGQVAHGVRVAAKTSMYSDFASVRSVEVYRRRNVIKVNAPLNYNQVYASNEDFDFVLNYILARVPEKARSSVKL